MLLRGAEFQLPLLFLSLFLSFSLSQFVSILQIVCVLSFFRRYPTSHVSPNCSFVSPTINLFVSWFEIICYLSPQQKSGSTLLTSFGADIKRGRWPPSHCCVSARVIYHHRRILPDQKLLDNFYSIFHSREHCSWRSKFRLIPIIKKLSTKMRVRFVESRATN